MATLATYGLNTALLLNPMTWLAIGIGVLIAAIVLMITHWDTVKSKATEMWAHVKDAFATGVNFVVDKLNWLIEKMNKIPGVNIPIIPKLQGGGNVEALANAAEEDRIDTAMSRHNHAGGIDYVPYDGYKANLHKGEKVVTATNNRNGKNGANGGGIYIAKIADQVIIREEADIEKVADRLASKLHEAGGLMA
jgi:hypothetical protein